MTTRTKTTIFWVALAIACASIAMAAAEPKPAECPAGTTLQGYSKDTDQPICRPVPTGCPYGDSIPVDSPKCAPPSETLAPTPTEPSPPVEYNLPDFEGK